MYKLIALDLDGTLLNSKHQISERNRQALLKCKEKGINIIVATGRLYKSITEYVESLELTGLQITLQGSVLYNADDNSLSNEINIEYSSFIKICEKLKKIDIPFCVYTKDYVYAVGPVDRFDKIINLENIYMKQVEDYNKIKKPIKILTITEDDMQISSLRSIDITGTKIMRTGKYFLEIISSNTGKEKGLEYIAKMMNIDRKEIIAFGDNENDIEMIKFAGTGVAMGNASESIKKISDIVAPHHDNDGVAEIIERIIA